MPRGYYLGQGLIPLGYSSSDDEEGPCKLPNGRTVCGPHGLVVCHKCCTDYSDVNDLLDDDDEDDEDLRVEEYDDEEFDGKPGELLSRPNPENEKVKGISQVFPSKFVPPDSNMAPLEVFPNRHRHIGVFRRTHSSDGTMLLLMTDGACLNNGQPNPKAGWAFYHGDNFDGEPLVISGRLENQGPRGDKGDQTSNRAELRAVLAALSARYWRGEGFKTIVFATDSSYVVDGATQWARNWVQNGWKTKGASGSGGADVDVKNKDLWKTLLVECDKAHGVGLAIQFWKIPREWNTLADEGAKKAAAEEDAPAKWQDIICLPF